MNKTGPGLTEALPGLTSFQPKSNQGLRLTGSKLRLNQAFLNPVLRTWTELRKKKKHTV